MVCSQLAVPSFWHLERPREFGFFGRGDDLGAQWIMAHPIAAPTQPPASLTVSEFTKELQYEVGSVQQNGSAVYRYYDPFYRYWVTVRNTGSSGVFFNVQGGGNA